LFFEFGEEVERVDGLELIEVGVFELVDNGAVERGEEDFLVSIAAMRGRAGASRRDAARSRRGIFKSARRERLAELVLTLLMFLEDFAGAFDDAAGQASQAGDFDAVTLIRASRFHAAKENDLAGSLFDGHVDVLHATEELREFGELVVMSGE
jgi:hypothetical protein